ncbi:MAG: efflux RND transporter periplasmic adaptor subunit [Verrucomicrobiales bacterium]|nr:efflux RND transporter periplasmic adaptor subunit [Verrucomicrobiales bacterium]
MPITPIQADQTLQQALAELTRLRWFAGPPTEFWPAFMAAVGTLISASRGLLILRDPNQPDRLKKLSDWAGNGHADRSTLAFNRAVTEIVELTVQFGAALLPLEGGATPGTKAFAVAVNLPLPGAAEKCVAAFLLPSATDEQARETLARLQLCADAPASYRQSHEILQARADVEKFVSVLDVMVLVNAEKRFLAAALAFCNGLATRYACDRVSLGWLEHGYIRLKAISRTERFDKNMAAVKALEVVMEEAFDQDEEVVWPAPEGSTLIARDHATFAREQASAHLCSAPIRLEDKPIAAITCERTAKPFGQVEVQQLRLACDQAARRLSELKRSDRWFGARWVAAIREKLGAVLGPEHTWAKVGAIAGAVALFGLCLPIVPYRVEGNFILQSDEVAYLTTPFDAYISQVNVRPGDLVNTTNALLKFDTADLELEEASALADQNRYLREVEKARAEAERLRAAKSSGLAEMRINQALVEQTQARLDLIRYRLQQSSIRPPFDGVLVEGDLRQRIGAHMKQGEPLFKMARIDALYAEAEINERDVHEILGKSEGEIAFVAQPKLKYKVKILRIEPAAAPKEGQNVFQVRCAVDGVVQPWWRPGMSGVCKINVEQRTLLWIITHRTVDFLRMYLWW